MTRGGVRRFVKATEANAIPFRREAMTTGKDKAWHLCNSCRRISADGAANASVSAIPVAPTTAAAPGAPYSALYAFGDRLTDTGNVSLATFGTLPVSPPYADRSFIR
jgi:hypothetical protein